MKVLTDLLNSTEGLRFLEAEGVFVTQQDFTDRLNRPVKSDLANVLGSENKKLVCSGQQIYVDYRQSVLSKIEILKDMENDPDLFPFFLWVDTDRAGSDNLITKFAWPVAGKKGPITILPPQTREIETRFVTVDDTVLVRAIDKLETYLRQSGDNREGAKEKYQQLRAIFTNGHPATLADFNLHLTNFLLTDVYNYAPYPLTLSSVLDQEFVLDQVNLFLNRIADAVNVFNQAIEFLVQKDINPQVRPLSEHYLPLFYSCEVDNTRFRLYHLIEGSDHIAIGACKCGQEYRFHLGQNNNLSIDEIAQTKRWSPDVCFPIFFNDFVSGFLAGKSSALYLIVMNRVMRQVLDKEPVPVLTPVNLELNENDSVKFDSLIYRYMAG